MTTKTCVTCKYHEDPEYIEHKCKKFESVQVDLVTGESYLQGTRDCRAERLSYLNVLALAGHSRCGPAGIYWEPKEGVTTDG